MLTVPDRAVTVAEVPDRGSDAQAPNRKFIGEFNLQGEWIAGARRDQGLHFDPVRFNLLRYPWNPAQEPVNRVSLSRLGQRKLESLAIELVGSVVKPVRPGNQRRPVSPVADPICRKGIEDSPSTTLVSADASTDLDDGRDLISEGNLDLTARWKCRFDQVNLLRPAAFKAN